VVSEVASRNVPDVPDGSLAYQDHLVGGLQAAHAVLCGAMHSRDKALYLLGRLVLGLVAEGRPGTSWNDPSGKLTAALRRSYHVLPAGRWDRKYGTSVSRQVPLAEVASVLASLDLTAIAYDVLGPLFSVSVARSKRRSRGVFLLHRSLWTLS
jgi:hypothetical protein